MWFAVHQLHGLLGYRMPCDGTPVGLSHLGLLLSAWKARLIASQHGLPESLQGRACILHV